MRGSNNEHVLFLLFPRWGSLARDSNSSACASDPPSTTWWFTTSWCAFTAARTRYGSWRTGARSRRPKRPHSGPVATRWSRRKKNDPLIMIPYRLFQSRRTTNSSLLYNARLPTEATSHLCLSFLLTFTSETICTSHFKKDKKLPFLESLLSLSITLF